MKSSFGKLKRFVQKNDGKERKEFPPSLKVDHLALASQEMQDMRDCCDSLLAAAAATTNSAYEFSVSLREMGGCLQEKAELYKDDESRNVFMMLGKVQLELQKLVDVYRSHIFLTITKPSESLLDQLQTVQEMKQQCDEKRTVYEYMISQQREKGRSKSGKGEGFSLEQLQQAHSEYEDEATLCVFRLKSLKQNQSLSLLTQAARHHTAQLNFFRKGCKSLEAVDTHVKLITDKQHINCHLSELDDGVVGEDEAGYSYDSNDNGELSFDYRPHKVGTEAAATSRNSMELDQEDQSFPKTSSVHNTELSLEKIYGDSQMLESEPRVSNYSHSAPILPEKKFDIAERAKQMTPSLTQKFHTYVLPTPDAAKNSSSRTSSVPRTRPASATIHNISHSSPLESKVNKRDTKEDNQSLHFYKTQIVVDQRDISQENQESSLLPPSLADGAAFRLSDSVDTSDHKKLKRQSFSGPISSTSRSVKTSYGASGPISSSKLPQRASGPMTHSTLPQPSSPKASRHSPPSVSPPKISELHELPRPPGIVSNKPSTSISGLSGPLILKNSESLMNNKGISTASNTTAAPLPIPPLTVQRSFSIPSSHSRAKALNVAKVQESQLQEKDTASPPLTPIALANAHAILASPRASTQASGI